MADKMRWRWGDTNRVMAAVDADTVIEIGDLVWECFDFMEGSIASPASKIGAVPNRLIWFARHFLGVAMQRSREGDTGPIEVATTGVFEFDCDPGFLEVGDLVRPGVDVSALLLCNQKVAGLLHNEEMAIGRVAKRWRPGDRTILVDITKQPTEGGQQDDSTEEPHGGG